MMVLYKALIKCCFDTIYNQLSSREKWRYGHTSEASINPKSTLSLAKSPSAPSMVEASINFSRMPELLLTLVQRDKWIGVAYGGKWGNV
jgi:hypothetical protein